MLTKTTERVLFQEMSDDMFMLSEVASQNGWTDVEMFWQGEMIKAPVDVNGWRLIPADQYEYSIPAEAVERVMLLVNSGVRIKGIVIADDVRTHQQKRTIPEPEPVQIDWDEVWDVAIDVLKVLGVIAAVAVAILTLTSLLAIIATIGVGILVVTAIIAAVAFDPKLIVLISDGNGEMIWVCLYTWFDPPSN